MIIKELKNQENCLMIVNVIILMWECVDKESKSQENSLMIEYVRIRVWEFTHFSPIWKESWQENKRIYVFFRL